MYRYNGVVVHQSYDDDGVIEVVDDGDVRALHFGSEARQSTMLLSQPNKLLSLYARAMMSWLLFKDNSQDMLMIGLGGGLLAKYFLNTLPDCLIKVIEYRRDVVRIARSHFGLPLDPRLKIHIGDGADYARQQSLHSQSQHDLILVDAFDHQGMAQAVTQMAFFDSCKSLLTPNGLLAMNLWGSDKALFAQIAWNLQQAFEDRVLFLPVRGRGNVIALAFNEKIHQPSLKELKIRARQLEAAYQLEFTLFVIDLKKHNPKTFPQLVKT
jgi:spermidine synthase